MAVKHEESVAPSAEPKAHPLPVEDEVAGSMVGLADDAEALYVAPNWKLVWWRFKKHRPALISVFIVIFIATIALVPEFFSTQDPTEDSKIRAFIPPQGIHLFDEDGFAGPFVYGVEGKRNPETLKMEWQRDETKKIPVLFFAEGYSYKILGLIEANIHLMGIENPEGPDRLHLLGTDRLGRDQWSRVMHGTRVSLSIGLVAVILSTILGILLGGISGYFGGTIDMVIQRLIEILQSLPAIPLWLALTAALPRDWSVEMRYFAITLILALIGWTTLGREVRGRFLTLREEDFVVSAKLIGCSQPRIIFRHMVPSFTSHLQSVALAPWLLIPGLAVIITVLALNILGDGLRDASDPYS
jgi:peptide/nickel transport system permease protein